MDVNMSKVLFKNGAVREACLVEQQDNQGSWYVSLKMASGEEQVITKKYGLGEVKLYRTVGTALKELKEIGFSQCTVVIS